MSLLVKIFSICLTLALISSVLSAFSGDLHIHDPSFIRSGHCYYVFGSTNASDLNKHPIHQINNDKSVRMGAIMNVIPKWIQNFTRVVPNPVMWAPDINYINGQYYLYYASSTLGSRNSVIALATSEHIEGPYADKGEVLHTTDALQYNAIDVEIAWTVVNGKRTQLWLVFGSYWEGIKARRLDIKTGKLSAEDTKLYSLASRGGNAIEASSTAYRNGYYYLFVSFDHCCEGVKSTYRVMVGRSLNITGPYVDSKRIDMMKGGGNQILASHGSVRGPGGQDVLYDNGVYRMIYHWYDANDGGNWKIDIVDLVWSADNWPTVGQQSKLNYK